MNNKEQIKKRIQQKELQLKNLHLHQSSSEVCNELYNTLIIQKAILKKELDDLEKNSILEGVKNGVRKVFSKSEKRICDYWGG